MTTNYRIRVMVVDDYQLVRQGLVTFVKAFDDLEIVGEATDGDEAVRLCEDMKPDVILMDMVMPNMTGDEAIQIIREKYPTVQVIALTSFTNDSPLVQKAMQAGAIGYLFKDISIDDLANAIRTAHRGDPILAPEATRMLIQASRAPQKVTFNLSKRELEVLALLKEGKSNLEIAKALFIEPSTVKYHLSKIYEKLSVSNRAEAVAIAMEHKLV